MNANEIACHQLSSSGCHLTTTHSQSIPRRMSVISAEYRTNRLITSDHRTDGLPEGSMSTSALVCVTLPRGGG